MSEQTAEDRLRVLYELRREIEEMLALADRAKMPMLAFVLELALAEAEDEMRKLEPPPR
jgi:hypothetical protein